MKKVFVFVALLVSAVVFAPSALSAIGLAPSCVRPYSDNSPFNTLIVNNPLLEVNSQEIVNAIGGNLTSDPHQYTYPVYYVDSSTPVRDVYVNGAFSYWNGPNAGDFTQTPRFTTQVPVPVDALGSAGSDGSIIFIDEDNGREYGFWQFTGDSVTNGYSYDINHIASTGNNAAGNGFVSRGAGIPYLAGLVRPCEIHRGEIQHALAFAYNAPASAQVYPASKSDGGGSGLSAVPEGARLQLDPTLTVQDLVDLGCLQTCVVIAQALQRYGMYTVDNSGSTKIMIEEDTTANWGGLIDRNTVAPLKMSMFRVLDYATGTLAVGNGGDVVVADEDFFPMEDPRSRVVDAADTPVNPQITDAVRKNLMKLVRKAQRNARSLQRSGRFDVTPITTKIHHVHPTKRLGKLRFWQKKVRVAQRNHWLVPPPWGALSRCETGGPADWNYNGRSGFDGMLQFHPNTWSRYAPKDFPAFAYQATPRQQIVVAEEVLKHEGWNAWPACSSKLGYR